MPEIGFIFTEAYHKQTLDGSKRAAIFDDGFSCKEGLVARLILDTDRGLNSVGEGKITSVQRMRVDDITLEQATLTGINDLDRLKGILKNAFGSEGDSYVTYVTYEPKIYGNE